jgi:peroxiredoxin
VPKGSIRSLFPVAAALLIVASAYVALTRWSNAPPSLLDALYLGRSLPPASHDIALGHPLPDFQLPDETGRPVAAPSLRGHPSIFVFYRGALCVACRAQLSDLAVHAAAFIAQGVRIFGVSADPPAVSAELRNTLHLPYSLLSDKDQTLVSSLCSARTHCLLLVDPQSTIRWGTLNDYWRGAAPSESVLVAAYRLSH